ncbi:MAG TPA: hypothetical protein VLM40_01210, partial [Gemmata sp.]|nr:hypothetical protein [Gemmata sp.]
PYNVNSPYVQFEYSLDGTGQTIMRQCLMVFPAGIPADQLAQRTPTSILYLPELGTYHFISAVTALSPTTVSLTLNDPSLQLGYPDAQLGAATHYRTYYFVLFGPPQPVLGEEVMQLPQEVCVDLRAGFSLPSTPGPGVDLDILFAPSGKLVSVPSAPNTGAYGHVFLWVHNPNKGAQPGPDLVDGGEQMIFVVKAQSGAVGTAPVDSGNPADPYDLARKAVAGH